MALTIRQIGHCNCWITALYSQRPSHRRCTVSQPIPLSAVPCFLITHFSVPNFVCMHRRRSGWTSGRTHGERRRWVRAEWDGAWGGVSLLQPTKGSGEHRELPQQPRPKTDFGVFWRLQNAHFCTYMYMTKSGGTICISVPPSKFWEDLSPLSPRDLRPCMYVCMYKKIYNARVLTA